MLIITIFLGAFFIIIIINIIKEAKNSQVNTPKDSFNDQENKPLLKFNNSLISSFKDDKMILSDEKEILKEDIHEKLIITFIPANYSEELIVYVKSSNNTYSIIHSENINDQKISIGAEIMVDKQFTKDIVWFDERTYNLIIERKKDLEEYEEMKRNKLKNDPSFTLNSSNIYDNDLLTKKDKEKLMERNFILNQMNMLSLELDGKYLYNYHSLNDIPLSKSIDLSSFISGKDNMGQNLDEIKDDKSDNFKVMYAYKNEDGYPMAILKNPDGYYTNFERNYPDGKSFILGEVLQFKSKDIKEWIWFDENVYLEKIEEFKRKEEIKSKENEANEIAKTFSIWEAKVESYKNQLKSNWEDFVNILIDYKIEKLYHFTDRTNIASIKANGGLYSRWSTEKNGIKIKRPGGNELSSVLDKRKGLENYVRLSFNERNPMLHVARKEGRISDPVFLEIDPIVILFQTTLFTKENATKNGVYPDSSLDFFKDILKGFKGDATNEISKLFGKGLFINPKAEILVFEKIPLKFIPNINEF